MYKVSGVVGTIEFCPDPDMRRAVPATLHTSRILELIHTNFHDKKILLKYILYFIQNPLNDILFNFLVFVQLYSGL